MKQMLLVIFLFLAYRASAQDPVFVVNPAGHSSKINRVLVTNDKLTIITFGDDKSICFWNATTGKLLKKQWLDLGNGEAGRIIDVDLGLRTDILAIARVNSEGKPVVNLIDIHKDKVVGTFEGFSQELGFVRIDPSEKFIITGSFQMGNERSESINLWKIPPIVSTPFKVNKPSAQAEGVQSHDLCFSDNGKQFVMIAWGGNKTLQISHDPNAIPEYKLSKGNAFTNKQGHIKYIPSSNKIFSGDHSGLVSLIDSRGNKEVIYERKGLKITGDTTVNDVYASPSGNVGMIEGAVGGKHGEFYEIFDLQKKERIEIGNTRWHDFVQFLSDSVFVADSQDGLIRYSFLTNKTVIFWKPRLLNANRNGLIEYGPQNKVAFDSLRQVFDFENHELLKSNLDLNGYSKRKSSFDEKKITMPTDSFRIKINDKLISIYPFLHHVGNTTYLNSGKILSIRTEYRTSRHYLLLYDPNKAIASDELEPEAEFLGSQGTLRGLAPSPDIESGYFTSSDMFGIISIWNEKSDAFTWRFKNQLHYWSFENINLLVDTKSAYLTLSPREKYKGNLKKGDQLISIGDLRTDKYQTIQQLERQDPLVPLKIKVLRGKEEISSEVTLRKIKVFAPLVSFASLENNEWICWTPQGYYAASTGGEKFGGWVINKEVNAFAEFHPMYDFKKQFYRPELLKLIPKTGSFKKAVELYNTQTDQPIQLSGAFDEKLPPSINWISPATADTLLSKNTVRLVVRVNSSTALQSAKILLNGRTVLRRDQITIKQERGLPQYLVSFDLDLPSLQNTINLYAENENGSTVSEERVLRLKQMETGIEKYKPNLYILSVGVSSYSNPSYNLTYADKDALAISNMYESQTGMLFKNVFSRVLTNEKATRANILDGFYWLEQNATQKDVVIMFIASHGLNEKDKFYIMPYDGDPERIRITGVDWFNFSDVLGNLPSKVLVFIDACHSGKLGTNLLAKRGETDLMEAIRALATEENGVVIMAASTGKESSLESSDWEHGAFTLALLEGMRDAKADLNQDGIINIREIDYFVAERVKELTHGAQHPTTQKPSVISEFPLLQTIKK